MRKIILACSLLFCIVMLSNAQEAKKAPDAKAVEALEQLIQKRATTAKDCFDATLSSWAAGTVSLESLVIAAEKLREAEADAAKDRGLKLKSLHTNFARFKNIRDKNRALNKHAVPGGEPQKLLLSELLCVETEIAIFKTMLSD